MFTQCEPKTLALSSRTNAAEIRDPVYKPSFWIPDSLSGALKASGMIVFGFRLYRVDSLLKRLTCTRKFF